MLTFAGPALGIASTRLQEHTVAMALRISGLVRTAERVRRQLSRPIAPGDLAALRQHVQDVLEHLAQWMDEAGHKASDLPSPSRRAYEFLRGLDWSTVQISDAAEGGAGFGRTRLVGLRKRFERALAALGEPALTAESLAEWGEWIRRNAEAIQEYLEQEGIELRALTEDTSATRAWLAYFSRRENLEAYAAAVVRARAAFEAALAAHGRMPLPVRVEFRPTRMLCRLRPGKQGTTAMLPTQAIAFSAEAFAALAARVTRRSKDTRLVDEAMLSQAVQAVRAELDELGGACEHSSGVHHDLGVVFERVNAEYFDGEMGRPRLKWGIFSGRRFGWYDAAHDTVVLSATLDRADVPEFVLEYVMYHELLHKERPLERNGSRRAVHTPAFRQAEKQFPRMQEAEAVLKRLAGE